MSIGIARSSTLHTKTQLCPSRKKKTKTKKKQRDVNLYEYCKYPIPYDFDINVENRWVEAFLDITYASDGETPKTAEAVAYPTLESNLTVPCKDSNASFWADYYENMCYVPTSYLRSLKGDPSFAKWFSCSMDRSGNMDYFWFYDFDKLECFVAFPPPLFPTLGNPRTPLLPTLTDTRCPKKEARVTLSP